VLAARLLVWPCAGRAPSCGRGADCAPSDREVPADGLGIFRATVALPLGAAALCVCGGLGTERSGVEGDGFAVIVLVPGRSARLFREASCVRPIRDDADETTGRDIARAGGAAAGLPALAPNRLVRVGVKGRLP
jgi:hypothetical protein